MMHLASPALEAVATDPRWADSCPPCSASADVRLYWEQAVAKPAQARTVLPWHQDNGYTPLEPEEYVTCWLALDDAELDNGCLWVIPGSHRNGTQPHHNDDRHGPFRVGHDGPDTDGVAVPVRRGSRARVLVAAHAPQRTQHHREPPAGLDPPVLRRGARSALSGRLLDDRLRAQPRRAMARPAGTRAGLRPGGVLANYDQR